MRPYIQGLDEIEFSNLMRNWFKHGGIEAAVTRKLSSGGVRAELTKNDYDQIKSHLPKIISYIEDTIRNELYGYAKELEESKTKLESFLDGVDFALRPAEKEDV